MEPKAIFVLVTAKNCPHCTNFRKNWTEVQQALLETGLIEKPVDIEVESMADRPNPALYPSDLKRWVRWFPAFLLFSRSSWLAAQPGSNKLLDGVIFNGRMTANGAEYEGNSKTTKETLVEWVKQNCNNGKLSSLGSSVILSMLAASTSSDSTSQHGHNNLSPQGSRTTQNQSGKSSYLNIKDPKSKKSNVQFVPSSACRLNRIQLVPRKS